MCEWLGALYLSTNEPSQETRSLLPHRHTVKLVARGCRLVCASRRLGPALGVEIAGHGIYADDGEVGLVRNMRCLRLARGLQSKVANGERVGHRKRFRQSLYTLYIDCRALLQHRLSSVALPMRTRAVLDGRRWAMRWLEITCCSRYAAALGTSKNKRRLC